MKKLSLSIALALGSLCLSAQAMPQLGGKVGQSEVVITESGTLYSDLSDARQNKRLVERLNRRGLNKENRPHLFKLIAQQLESKTTQVSSDLALREAQGCTAPATSLCSFLKHLGAHIQTETSTGEPHLILSVLNSEYSTTNNTSVEIGLVDENFNELTMRSIKEFFGDDTDTLKRKTVYSASKLDGLLERLKQVERVYADAWVTVAFVDAEGNETLVEKNSLVEYPRDELIAGIEAALANKAGESISINSTLFDLDVVAPVDHRSANGDGVKDNKIIVCLNRNYGDCDYTNNYPTNTPNGSVRLKVPFEGQLKFRGKLLKIYRPDWSIREVQEDGSIKDLPGEKPALIDYGTNIFIQTKENGGAHTIAGHEFQDIAGFFSDNIQVEREVRSGQWYSTVKWNIPRNQGYFGDASLYGRYQDAHWIMNMAFEVETRAGRPASQLTYVVGSTDLDLGQGWNSSDRPMMQIVYSCLAKGSQILLPNGKTAAIESLSVGDQVLGTSEYATQHTLPLVIKDISIGTEIIPMIELTTASGNTLLLTESHPVITATGKAVWAKELVKGERILAMSGNETITSVKSVKYNDKVYNLKLARLDNEKFQQGESFTMFANGVQVGDLSYQGETEFRQKVETQQDVLNRLPEAWHVDYLRSLK